MTDSTSTPQSSAVPPQPNTTPKPSGPSHSRKIIGQCPVCSQSFTSHSSLRSHMENPPNHPPAVDLDEISTGSFGEVSSGYSSAAEDEPSFSGRTEKQPTMEEDGFEFVDPSDFTNAFPDGARFGADQGSVHTIYDDDDEGSSVNSSFTEDPRNSQRARTNDKQIHGVLFCPTCDRYFGNLTHFKRHFMFGIKHGEEPREMRDLYYKTWAKTWADEVRDYEMR